MEIGIASVAESAEQRWLKIIEAVRGSAAVQVWFRYKREAGFPQAPDEPEAPDLASSLNEGDLDSNS